MTTRLKDQKGDHACGQQEVGDLAPQNWYTVRDIHLLEQNIRLEEHNFSRGQSSNIPHDVRASIPNTDGQLRDILPDMESNDIDDQVGNTQSDVEPIDIEYLLEDNQRAVNFLTAGTQEDKQRFIDLPAKCNRILHQPGSPAVGLNLKDTDNLSPSTPKDSYRTRQSKKI